MQHKNFLIIALFATYLTFNTHTDEINRHETLFNQKTVQLQLDMRKLWEDHIVWTRNVIISSIANLADICQVTERLLQNQDDIGNAIKPYFDTEIGNKLSGLLREHITIAANVIADAIAGDTQKFNDDYEAWQKNARHIAKFLNKKNSHWSRKKLKKMLYTHLELTTGEVSSRLQSDWEADINFYDENHIHMLEFADILTKGIVKKFPNKFD